MQRTLAALVVVTLAAVSRAQTPPISTTIHCEDVQRGFGADLFRLGRPYWAKVTNSNSDYWQVTTEPTDFGHVDWVRSTDIALFDSAGQLLFENQFAQPGLQASALLFGRVWSQGLPGSPVMLTPGQDYYLGIAGGGSVFADGFNCNMSSDRGNIGGFTTPAPGTVPVVILGGMALLRRRR